MKKQRLFLMVMVAVLTTVCRLPVDGWATQGTGIHKSAAKTRDKADALANVHVDAGKTALENHNMAEAKRNFALALGADPKHPEANLYYAVTRILALVYEKEFNDLLTGFGVGETGRDIYGWTASLPKDVSGRINLPTDSPKTGEVVAYVNNRLIPEIDGALANLQTLENTKSDKTNPITVASPGMLDADGAFEVDYGDVALYKAFLKGAKSLLLMIASYDLDVDLDAIVAKINAGNLDINADILNAYPDFLNLNASHEATMAAAKTGWIDGINDCLSALDFIDSEEDPQLDDLFSIGPDPEDIRDEAMFRFALNQAGDSLQGKAEPNFTMELGQFMNLGAYFDNPFNLRDLAIGEGIQIFLKNQILYQVERAIGNLTPVTAAYHQVLQPATYPVETPVEIDYGDIAVMKAGLQGIAAYIKIVCAYNIKVDTGDIINHLKNENFSINNHLLAGLYPNLLKLLSDHQLGAAKLDVQEAIDAYLAGADFIRKETDPQGDDFITAEDIATHMTDAELQYLLAQVKASLLGPALIPGSDPFVMDLTRFFDDPIHLVDYLPDFSADNHFLPGTFPDPTFSGIFPGYGPSRWHQWLLWKGDLYDDDAINMIDVIFGLQICAGIQVTGLANPFLDIDGDRNISLAEVLYLMRMLARTW